MPSLARRSSAVVEFGVMAKASMADPTGGATPLVSSVVEELLAGDEVVLYCVDADFFEDGALAGGFWGDVKGEVDDELVGVRAVEERAGHGFAVEGFIGDPVLGFLDDRTLPGSLLAVAFDGDDCRRIEGAHHIEVLPLPAQVHKLFRDG